MGAVEHRTFMRFHHGGKQPEYKKQEIESDIALHNGTVARYQEMKAQYDRDAKEFNDSYQALLVWQKELEGRKKELDALLLELKNEEHVLELERQFVP